MRMILLIDRYFYLYPLRKKNKAREPSMNKNTTPFGTILSVLLQAACGFCIYKNYFLPAQILAVLSFYSVGPEVPKLTPCLQFGVWISSSILCGLSVEYGSSHFPLLSLSLFLCSVSVLLRLVFYTRFIHTQLLWFDASVFFLGCAGPAALFLPHSRGAAPLLEHRGRHAARAAGRRAADVAPLPKGPRPRRPGGDRPRGRRRSDRPGLRRHPAVRGLPRPPAARPEGRAVPPARDRRRDRAAARPCACIKGRDAGAGRRGVQDRAQRHAAGAGADRRHHRPDRPRAQRPALGLGGVRLRDVSRLCGCGGAGTDDAQVLSPISRAPGGGRAAAGGGRRAHGPRVVPRAAR